MGSEAMSYAEMRFLGYGRAHERLGKESMGNFDDCQLTLQTAIDPVCTPWGIIFSREAILNYLLQQRRYNRLKQNISAKNLFVKEHKRKQGLEHKAQIEYLKFK